MSAEQDSVSYEEIRSICLDILAERERVRYPPNQYEHLACGVAEVIARREAAQQSDASARGRDEHRLSGPSEWAFQEVFWSLFQEGVIILGLNSNNGFPWFRLSRFGERVASGDHPYFFHDVAGYEEQIRKNVPGVHDTTVLYLKEAMQAFRSRCLLSATVMLGVAAEHQFELLLEAVRNGPHASDFGGVDGERGALKRIRKFKALLEQKHLKQMPSEIKEDMDTHFASVSSVIRTSRNEAGHPTGKILDREQVYVLLHLFIPYAKKISQLMRHFE